MENDDHPSTKMIIKLPRALFEEAISKMSEKKQKRKRTHKRCVSTARQKKRRHNNGHNSNTTIEHPSPSAVFAAPPTPPSEPPSPLDNDPSPTNEPTTKECTDIPPELRPSRESTKKFYRILSTVVNGSMSPTESEIVTANKDCCILLSKSQKKAIAQLLHRRRHFPAEISTVDGKGTGVKTLRSLLYGQFVCEYAGELISKTEATKREKIYSATSTSCFMSCYMYYFEHRGQEMCIDATSDEGAYGIGRLINHSVDGNLATVKIIVDGAPRLAFVANRDIQSGEELAYDYGDRGLTSLAAFPWLKK